MDLDKAENEIKENTKLDIPSIATALAAPIAPAAAPIALVATPASTRTAIPTLLNQ